MAKEITVQALEALPGKKRIVDIRSRDSFEKGTMPQAENIPLDELDIKSFSETLCEPVYILCHTGKLSEPVVEELEELGHEAYNIHGGYHSYLRLQLHRMTESETEMTARREKAERSLHKKFRKELWSPFTKALQVYKLIEDGDKIAVCISGGKDSMLMAKLFGELLKYGKQNFSVVFLVMNPGYNELNYKAVMDNAKLLGIPVEVFRTEIFDIVASQDGSPCYLCARMRRGYLYSKAKELGCNKIALGHHYDDVIETTLMGMLYGGQVQTMMPKLHSTNFPGMELIRPLYLIHEKDIKHWRDYNDLHFIQCACRLTESCASCGGTEQGSKRGAVKALIASLAEENPQVPQNIFRSVENVNLDTVIAYKQKGVRHHFLDEYHAEQEK